MEIDIFSKQTINIKLIIKLCINFKRLYTIIEIEGQKRVQFNIIIES